MRELPKSQKKIARELINTGLKRECKKFMEGIQKFLQKSDIDLENSHGLYLNIYKKVDKFDNHIARRYNDMTGSKYFDTVLGLYFDKILTEKDIELFDEEVQKELTRHIEILSS